MAEFRVGVIGLGGRGMGHIHGILTERDDTVITAVCDVYEDRLAEYDFPAVSPGILNICKENRKFCSIRAVPGRICEKIIL